MNILMTGITGFLGYRLANFLIKDGHDIIGIVRGESSSEKIEELREICLLIDSEDNLELIFKCNEVDAIIHCATNYGRVGNRLSQIYDSNILLPTKLVDYAINYKVNLFINTDSFFREDVDFKTFISNKSYLQMYTLSKRHFYELMKVSSLYNDIKFVNMKLEHIYGNGDSKTKFVPMIINRCIHNEQSIEMTDGLAVRDFIFIDDVIDAFRLVLDNQDTLIKGFTTYSVGKGYGTSVQDFVNLIKIITCSKTKLNFGSIDYRTREIMKSIADISELQKIGWMNKYDDKSGLMKYISEEFLI